MAFQHMPDFIVPPSHLRCEAMAKPVRDTYQVWRHTAHRCIRKAMQGRDGRSVCAIHSRVDKVTYWNGETDNFPHKKFWRWIPSRIMEAIANDAGEK